jgi:hypothetical protein
MLTADEDWFWNFVKSAAVCKALKLTEKWQRIAVHRVLMDDEDADLAVRTAQGYTRREPPRLGHARPPPAPHSSARPRRSAGSITSSYTHGSRPVALSSTCSAASASPGPGWLKPVLAGCKLLAGFNIKFDLLHALQDATTSTPG